MQAKEEAKHAKTKEKIQEVMARPAVEVSSEFNKERPAVPAAKEKHMEQVQEVPIAGRTKMTISKNNGEQEVVNSHTDDSGVKQELATAQQEAKIELNAILKRSPSMSLKSPTDLVSYEANHINV